MDAAQAMTGSGGWPLTVVPDPGRRAVLRGHVLPRRAAARAAVVPAGAGRDRRGVDRAARRGRDAGREDRRAHRAGRAAERLQGAADGRDHARGVLATAGSVRRPTRRLRRRAEVPTADDARVRAPMRGARVGARRSQIVATTLDRMADGGIYDHLGGGFARYSTDASWHVPHFEKMLYDNAQLARLYTRAWQVTRDDRYRRVATETIEYLLREMQHAEGGFFSSQDADSEGVEGKFFVWGWDELVALVGPAVATCFGATPSGNWEGTNVLWRPRSIADVAAEHGLPADELAAEVEDARRMLFEIREGRVHPATDDKVLTAWNALAIGALRRGGPRLRRASPTSGRRRSLRGVRPDPPAGRTRTPAAFVAERDGWAAGVRRRLRAPGGGVPHPLRDHVRAPVVRGGGDAGRRVAPSVPRRRTRRLLPDGFRRRGARPSPEGAVRQRDAVRELGGGRDAPASRVVHRRRGGRASRRFPRSD